MFGGRNSLRCYTENTGSSVENEATVTVSWKWQKKIPASISQETLLKRGSFTPHHKWRNGFTGTSEYSNTCCKKCCSSPCRNHSIFLMDCHECGNIWESNHKHNSGLSPKGKTQNFVSEKYVNVEGNQVTVTETRRVWPNTLPFH